MDQHISKIKVGGVSQPSWFDAETHQQCREKERLHQTYKGTIDPDLRLSRYLTFSIAEIKIRNSVSQKMSDSFEDEEDSGLITKKLWSYVTATANSTRLPVLVHLDSLLKFNPLDQAEVFNTFFYKQFADESTYDVNIDNSHSEEYNIDFNVS